MTEIGFYHLQRQPVEAALPRLLEKVLGAGMKAVVRTPDKGVTTFLDQALWTFDPAAFLPHGTEKSGHSEAQPVYLTSGEEVPNAAEALVVINEAELGDPGDFKRCFLIFDGRSDEALEAARRRWKALKDAGHALTYWKQSNEGRWEKETSF